MQWLKQRFYLIILLIYIILYNIYALLKATLLQFSVYYNYLIKNCFIIALFRYFLLYIIKYQLFNKVMHIALRPYRPIG
jgi:hypothetical protein